MVDEIVHPTKLQAAAIKIALSLVNKTLNRRSKASILNKFLDKTAIGRFIIFREARKKVLRQTYGNYPAPMEILNCVEIGMKYGQERLWLK